MQFFSKPKKGVVGSCQEGWKPRFPPRPYADQPAPAPHKLEGRCPAEFRRKEDYDWARHALERGPRPAEPLGLPWRRGASNPANVFTSDLRHVAYADTPGHARDLVAAANAAAGIEEAADEAEAEAPVRPCSRTCVPGA